MSALQTEKTNSVIDKLTGELLSHTTEIETTATIPVEPNYIKLYIDDLGLLNKLSGNETRALIRIASRANYDGCVNLPLYEKEGIGRETGMKLQAVNNAIVKLTAKGILKRLRTATYTLNPDLFARGKWRDIREQRKAFQSITTYYPDGKKVTQTQAVEPMPEIAKFKAI
jgi:hypothetical protein